MLTERIILANDDDDLYTGYNEFHPALDTRTLPLDEGVQQAILKSSYGKRAIGTGYKTSGPGPSRMGISELQRSSVVSSRKSMGNELRPETARPMTAVRGAGYTSQGNRSQMIFDPLNQAKSIATPLQVKDETSAEAKVKQMEKKVNDLIEECCLSAYRKEYPLALEKAKDASAKERSLNRLKEQYSVTETFAPNVDITFTVLFNLAVQYCNNEMYSEAINIYQSIIKNRSFTNTGRLKINIGNIYYHQSNFPKAIKFYRMALDQIPNSQREIRLKIMHNIGLSFIKVSQYADAITSFEYIMSEKSDFKTALHLMICHYALGDKEKMKKCFLKLLDVNAEDLFEDRYSIHADDDDPTIHLLIEAIKNDNLRVFERELKNDAQWCILTGAKLIAPVIGDTFSEGYEWCVEQIRTANYADIANDLEINKAVKHLRKREFNEAIATLKTFEKKENKAASTAATNLSFLYFLQNELINAEKYADEAINADHYNSGAMVNKGNVCFRKGDFQRAKECYKEALVNDSGHAEAIYNLALINKKLGQYENALDSLFKLQTMTKNHAHVLYQIANIYELMGDKDQALDFYHQLITFVPSDPSLLTKLSDLAEAERDKQQSFSYLTDSYRYFSAHIPTIERLAAYYIENKVYEKAIRYLDRASQVQPIQIKWQLMIAACYRRSGNYQQAFQCYKMIHNKFPENIECLKFLIRVCSDLGLSDGNDYAEKLKKLEKSKEIKEQRGQSGMPSRSTSRASARRSAASSREGSASSSSSGYLTSGSPRSTASNKINYKNNKQNDTDINRNIVDMSVYEEIAKQTERPTTSWKRTKDDDDFANEEIDDILPE